MFDIIIPFHSNILGKAGAYPSGAYDEAQLWELPTNFRAGWNLLAANTTLAYYNTAVDVLL